MNNLVEWKIEIDYDLFVKVSRVCESLGTTLEDVTAAFLKFCIVPENLPKVKEILCIE